MLGSALPAGVDASGSGHSKGTQSGTNGGHMYPSEPSASLQSAVTQRQTASLSNLHERRKGGTNHSTGVTSLAFSPQPRKKRLFVVLAAV